MKGENTVRRYVVEFSSNGWQVMDLEARWGPQCEWLYGSGKAGYRDAADKAAQLNSQRTAEEIALLDPPQVT